jgi:hypothetical protein
MNDHARGDHDRARSMLMAQMRGINTRYAPVRWSSLGEWETYAAWLRRQVGVSLALEPEAPRAPLKARTFGLWQGDGYRCEKVHFESLPGYRVTGNLFRPAAGPSRRGPGILCPHGHWADGRLHDRDPLGSVIARCIQLARMGAVVFSYDMVGYNDSCQVPHRDFQDDPAYGLSLMALQTWNSIRALDWLLERGDVDPRRIGITGASGGGTQTFALCAVDPRVAAAAPICMISYQMQGGCICENAPLLRLDATSVDIARLFAPKPLFMGSCTGDWTRDTATEEYPAMANVWALYEARDAVRHFQVDEDHNYNREMREHAYGFFNQVLFAAGSAEPVAEPEIERPPLRHRMVYWGREAPPRLTAAELRALWRARADRALRPHLKDAHAARRDLGPLLPYAVGETPSRRKGGTSPGIEIRREGEALVVHEIAPLAYPQEADRMFPCYNRTPFAERVLAVADAVEASGRVRLVGRGPAGPAVLLAAALSPGVTAVEAELRGFEPDHDASWSRCFDTPLIRGIGGMATVFARIGPRPVRLLGASEAARTLHARYGR